MMTTIRQMPKPALTLLVKGIKVWTLQLTSGWVITGIKLLDVNGITCYTLNDRIIIIMVRGYGNKQGC